jgi:hypothetical protein
MLSALNAPALALGKQADKLIMFFDGCRGKRNVIDCTGVQIATATEAAELLQRAQEFSAPVESWITGGGAPSPELISVPTLLQMLGAGQHLYFAEDPQFHDLDRWLAGAHIGDHFLHAESREYLCRSRGRASILCGPR